MLRKETVVQVKDSSGLNKDAEDGESKPARLKVIKGRNG